jgi:outer membrane lipase/esterase
MKMGDHGSARIACIIAIAWTLLGHAMSAEAASAGGITVTAAPAQPQIVHPATSTLVNVTETNDITILGWQESTPAHGTLQLPANGCPTDPVSTCPVTYTAAAGYIGQDQFTVSVTDDANKSGAVTVTVTTYPSAPTAKNFTVQANSTASVTVDLATNQDITYDPAVPATGVTVTIAAAPAHGTASVSGTTITYTPNGTFGGTDTVGYQVSDGGLQNASATMTIAVQQAAVNIPADIVGQTQAAGSGELTAAGFTVAVVQQVSASVTAGRVITTQPAPGTAAPRGSAVKLIVSQGPGSAAAGPISNTPGLTGEQVAVARGLEKTCEAMATAYTGGATLNAKQQDLLNKCTAIISDYSGATNVPGLQQTLNAISGRQATASARIPMQFAAGQITNIQARLDALRSGERGISFSGLDFGAPSAAQPAFTPLWELAKSVFGGSALGGGAGADSSGDLFGNRLGVFITGTLRRGTETTTNAEEGFDFKNTGLTFGADYRLGDAYILGIAGGYSKSRSIFDDNGGRLDARHTSVALYGSYFTDRLHVDWQAGFGHNSYDLGRSINYDSSSSSVGCSGGVCSTDSSGTTGAREYSFSTSAGMDFHRDAFAFGPTLELDYKQVAVNGFTESGPSGLDLAFGGMTSNSLLAKVGGFASYAIKTSFGVILPQVRARYLHEFLNDARTQSVEFAADTLPGADQRAFNIYTAQPDRNYLDWRASVLFQFPHGIAGFIDYGSVAGLQNISTHELNIGLRVETGRH